MGFISSIIKGEANFSASDIPEPMSLAVSEEDTQGVERVSRHNLALKLLNYGLWFL